MSVPVIGGRAGLVAFERSRHLQTINSGGQMPDASQAGEAGPPTGAGRSQVVSLSSPAQNAFSAKLGSMAAGGASQDAAGSAPRAGMEPPAADGSQASSFGSSLKSLLQAVLSGDMDGAQNAVAALQSALTSTDAGPSNPWPVTSAASGPATPPNPAAPATAPAAALAAAEPGDVQSTFKAGLKDLLTAVQSGDAAASKTAASTLVFAMSAARQEGAGALTPREWGSQDSVIRSNLANLLQSVQAGDMASARTAATAIQSELNAVESQSASGAPAESAGTSAPPAAPAFTTASASSTAGPDQDGTFMSHLKGLLAAVESGDVEAAQTAAATLFGGLTAQAEEFGNQFASLVTPPSDRRSASLGNALSSYFQWS
jgi:ribosomal protein S20